MGDTRYTLAVPNVTLGDRTAICVALSTEINQCTEQIESNKTLYGTEHDATARERVAWWSVRAAEYSRLYDAVAAARMSEEVDPQCPAVDLDGVRCELFRGHGDVHRADAGFRTDNAGGAR